MKNKTALRVAIVLTFLSLIMGLYDGGDCTASIVFGLISIAIACERGEED